MRTAGSACGPEACSFPSSHRARSRWIRVLPGRELAPDSLLAPGGAELAEIGAAEVAPAGHRAVLATITATTVDAPVVGFLAHVATTPAFSSTGVRPRVHRAWNGADIEYPDAPDLVLSPGTSACLASKIRQDIVTDSVVSLLGADDKADVAVAMTAARQLLAHPEIPRGRIRVAFAPDEEIDQGTERLPQTLLLAGNTPGEPRSGGGGAPARNLSAPRPSWRPSLRPPPAAR